MKRRFEKLLVFISTVFLISVMAVLSTTASAEEGGKWIAAWGTGITEIGVGGYNDIGVILTNATCRSVITPTVSGTKLRLRLSNVYGVTDLRIDRMTVAKNAGASKIDKSTLVNVYFNGKREAVVPAGKEIYSDPVEYKVTAMEPISVSTYISKANEIRTAGFSGGYTYMVLPGNYTDKETLGLFSIKMQYGLVSVVPVLSSLDVYSESESAYSVVVIGDSTVSNEFPYYLANQITMAGYDNVGVVGKGIIGNSLLSDGFGIGEKIYGDSLLHRFDVDALSQSGVKYVILKIGCNDIVHPKSGENATEYGAVQPTAEEMIAGYTEIANRCHAAGVKIVCVALMQWKGYTRDFFGTGAQYTFSEDDWKIAEKIDKWMESTDVFDAFVNLNPASQDPNDPLAINPKYTEDGAHPNDSLQILWSKIFPLETVGVIIKPRQVQLNNVMLSLDVNKRSVLTATVIPENAANKNVKWTSSNIRVAKVNSAGVVTGVSNGTAAITCTTALGEVKARCLVKITTPVTGVKLSRTALNMYVGKKAVLTSTVLPSSASYKNVQWYSSNKAVVAVNSLGQLYARKAGTAVVTCRTVDGKYTATCKITVRNFVNTTGVKLSVTAKNIYVNNTYRLTAAVYPSTASNKNVKWASSNPKVASVSSTGIVKGISVGTCKITCTTANGKTAVCTIKVVAR